MDNNFIIIVIGFFLVLVVPKILGAIRHISPAKAKELLSSGAVVIDVRESSEYRTGHINKALNIPVNSISSRIKKSIPKKDSNVIVYCQSGSRSSNAYKTLKRLGYTNVYDLGGITRWPYGTTK